MTERFGHLSSGNGRTVAVRTPTHPPRTLASNSSPNVVGYSPAALTQLEGMSISLYVNGSILVTDLGGPPLRFISLAHRKCCSASRPFFL